MFGQLISRGTTAIACLTMLTMSASAQDVDQAVSMTGPGIAVPIKGELDAAQRKALFPPRGPRPAIYRMRALHSGLCLNADRGTGLIDQQERLVQYSCAPTPNPLLAQDFGAFAIVPHPRGGFTIRTFRPIEFGGRMGGPAEIANCLTVARNVVFGPARIEFRGCDVPDQGTWSDAGIDDQRFNIIPVGDDTYTIQLATFAGEQPDCLSARDGNRNVNGDFVKAPCTGQADQRFILSLYKPIPPQFETGVFSRTAWRPFADGAQWLSPVGGVDLSGPSYSSFATNDDRGEYCMRCCAELTQCKAWTWSAAGYAGNSQPMCAWKSEAGTPINRGKALKFKLISGVVRP